MQLRATLFVSSKNIKKKKVFLRWNSLFSGTLLVISYGPFSQLLTHTYDTCTPKITPNAPDYGINNSLILINKVFQFTKLNTFSFIHVYIHTELQFKAIHDTCDRNFTLNFNLTQQPLKSHIDSPKWIDRMVYCQNQGVNKFI